MAKDPAFLFYPGDYLRDTQNLSEKSQVAYDRIMCEHMRNICEDMNNITVSKKQVNFFSKRLNNEEKEELMFVLKKIKDSFQIEWVAESIAKRKVYSNSRSKNRGKKSKKDMKTYDYHMENENENVIEDININEFENFWIKYHEITKLSKTDKEPTLKYWKKLNKTEKQKAIDNIENYYNSLNDVKYCKKARTYLNHKNFNDDFKPVEKILRMP